MPVSLENLVVGAYDERKLRPYSPRVSRFCARPPWMDAKINILVGSIRSSKTWATFPKILQLCKYKVGGRKVITGASKSNIERNTLGDLFEIIGEGNYSYNRQSGALSILGCHWDVIGAHDIGSEKYIRGITIGACVSDELVLMPENFWDMLISRMSPPGARFYATTNPDNPYHWVKTKVLENKDYSFGLGRQENGKQFDLWWDTWNLDDNPNIDQDTKEFYKRSYTGVFYERFINGRWLMAEGMIYANALSDDTWYTDEQRPIGLLSQHGHVDHFIPIDYGTANAMVYGNVYDDGHRLWCEDEYYWDSKARSRQKTDAEYAHDLINGCSEANWPGFPKDQRLWPTVIIDPSAASFKVELINRGVVVMDAKNEVMDGIRRTSTMFASKRLKIHKKCVHTKKDLESYAWDKKVREDDAQEKPLKARDHGCDMIRYGIETKIDDWRLGAAA